MTNGAVQAKDLDGEAVIALIRECNEARCDYRGSSAYHGGRPGYAEGRYDPPKGHYANGADLAARLGVPTKVLLAKLERLIEKGYVKGCTCGCRGDFEVVE